MLTESRLTDILSIKLACRGQTRTVVITVATAEYRGEPVWLTAGGQRIVTRWPRASPLLGYGIEAACQGAMTGTFGLAIQGRFE